MTYDILVQPPVSLNFYRILTKLCAYVQKNYVWQSSYAAINKVKKAKHLLIIETSTVRYFGTHLTQSLTLNVLLITKNSFYSSVNAIGLYFESVQITYFWTLRLTVFWWNYLHLRKKMEIFWLSYIPTILSQSRKNKFTTYRTHNTEICYIMKMFIHHAD